MKDERGFTLIELLVVIAILAVLFGVTALALAGVGSNAETETMKAEKDVVQTAIDVHLAEGGSLTAHTGAGTDSQQVGPNAGGDFSTYLRRDSKYYYCWDADGNITHQHTTATDCAP